MISFALLLFATMAQSSPGSSYSEVGRYAYLSGDLRARRVGDTITIVVSDKLNATSGGNSASARTSKAKASITSLAGSRIAIGALTDLAALGGQTKLDGAGSTSRTNALTTTVSGRVVEVLPNGDMLIEATKDIGVNSEKHHIAITGIVRWNDVTAGNLVRSDRIGQLSIQLNGKGLVSDAIRRPNIIYRILLGILPF